MFSWGSIFLFFFNFEPRNILNILWFRNSKILLKIRKKLFQSCLVKLVNYDTNMIYFSRFNTSINHKKIYYYYYQKSALDLTRRFFSSENYFLGFIHKFEPPEFVPPRWNLPPPPRRGVTALLSGRLIFHDGRVHTFL